MNLDHSIQGWSLEVLAKSRPRSDMFLCSIKEGTGYRVYGALQISESIFILPVWFCWYHLYYIPKWYKRVSPSQSIKNEAHDVWIALNKRHEIVVSWCSCIEGLAQTCNHVIAVLFKVEHGTNMGYNDPACTSIPCGRNTSTTNNVQPCRLSNLNLRKDNCSKI
jgi:hypothetical protein